MTEQIIAEISARLTDLRIPFSLDSASSIAINTEFVDANWSTGTKKIAYEAAVAVSASEQTVFMYEKTVEHGGGISGMASGETSFQSGSTLFRKVKIIAYGPDGKAFDVTLDLGAIPKAVKETAARYGFKFKTVLSKKKLEKAQVQAVQPPVRPPIQPTAGRFCSACGAPLQAGAAFCEQCGARTGLSAPQQPTAPRPPAPPVMTPPYGQAMPASPQPVKNLGAKKGLPGLIAAFAVLVLFAVLFFALSGNTAIGWIIAIVILALTFLFMMRLSAKGILAPILTLLAALLVILIVYAFSLPGDKSGDASSQKPTAGQALNSSTSPQATTDSIFTVNYLSIDSQPIIYNPNADDFFNGSLAVRTRFIVDINTNMDYFNSGKATQDDLSIVGATLSVTPLSVPNGTFVSYTYKQNDNMTFNGSTLPSQSLPADYVLPVFDSYDAADAAEAAGTCPYILSIVKDTTSVQLRFGTGLLGLTSNAYISDYDQYMQDAVNQAASNGLTADTLRYTVRVTITLETKSGKKQIITFDRAVMPDGYNMLQSTPGGAQYAENYQSGDVIPADLKSKPAE
ncbi:zinc ribbon domain-containing protein [Oscillospiraceae bacterium CM]|nr:zinc ribbon domain-containing protein [Oscillospiraceae bacterium CM]